MISNNIQPWKIRDNRHYSILHIAALDNNTKLINFMIQFVKDNYPDDSDETLKNWVITKTDDDEFTALHFAVFRGNIEMTNIFLEMGGDLSQ